MTIASNVKKLRKKMGVNQQELAEEADIAHSAINRIESGEVSQPKMNTLKKLADVFGTTIDYLVGRSKKVTDIEALKTDNTALSLFKTYLNLKPKNRKLLDDFAKLLQKKQ